MAQLFYKYGCMNSGKSIEILKVAHNYEEQGKEVLLLTSGLDTRSGVGRVESRIGIGRNAIAISPTSNLLSTIVGEILTVGSERDVDCILVDEAQFLTKMQVKVLAHIVDDYGIPVICFGLKNDFQNNLFEGTAALLAYADKVEEIKTICWYCDKKAVMNLRLNNGKPVYDGEQVMIGGNDSYVSVCRKHYKHPL